MDYNYKKLINGLKVCLFTSEDEAEVNVNQMPLTVHQQIRIVSVP